MVTVPYSDPPPLSVPDVLSGTLAVVVVLYMPGDHLSLKRILCRYSTYSNFASDTADVVESGGSQDSMTRSKDGRNTFSSANFGLDNSKLNASSTTYFEPRSDYCFKQIS